MDQSAVATRRLASATRAPSARPCTSMARSPPSSSLAAARGETTLKRAGQPGRHHGGQVRRLDGAATAVYAAGAAIGQGRTGRTGRQRRCVAAPPCHYGGFSADDATGAFNALSKEFNVPSETATDAVYRMGQRFHTSPRPMEAARASLYSFKTGEVDVESSTKNLHRHRRASVCQASGPDQVYDQINNAQNTFGISHPGTPRRAGEGGRYLRNAGGDLDYLLGLFVAINRRRASRATRSAPASRAASARSASRSTRRSSEGIRASRWTRRTSRRRFSRR
jgi:hypothetical protein